MKTIAICFLFLVGCAATRPSDTIMRAVQSRVVYELHDTSIRNGPSIEFYLEHAALSIRETAKGENLSPDFVKNEIGKSEARQHWSIQAELILDDLLRLYESSQHNRANLIAVADGINLARQTR